MYSKNDYRYYLEHRIVEDNYLAHYGVKGMKWKQHLKKKFDQNFEAYKGESKWDYSAHGGDKGRSKYIGVESKKNPSKYLEVSKRSDNKGRREIDIHFSPTRKDHYKRFGRVRLNSGKDGGLISIDTSRKKRYRKNNSEEAARIVRGGLYSIQGTTQDALNNTKKRRKK